MPMTQINNLIIGAGPAGLAIAAWLKHYEIDYDVWESSDKIAYRWTRHYKRLHLHTVKKHSHLPFLEFPNHYPTFVSRDQLLEYCKIYADKFQIHPTFNRRLVKATWGEGHWLVSNDQGDTHAVHNLIIATGINNFPMQPSWPGAEDFQGQIIHSHDYRDAIPFAGKKCLVVGMGNTGAEIALDLAEQGLDTSISIRSALNIVPREAFGRPTQETALRLQYLPRWLQDRLGNLLKRLTIGDLKKHGITLSHISPMRQLRTTGKTPLIDLGTVDMIKKGKIKVLPDLKSFNGRKLLFEDDRVEEFDLVICATGYRSGIGTLIPEIKPYLDSYGNPKFTAGIGKWSGLYFLGFDNFRPGGILGIINRDSAQIAKHIRAYRTPLNQLL